MDLHVHMLETQEIGLNAHIHSYLYDFLICVLVEIVSLQPYAVYGPVHEKVLCCSWHNTI